MAQENFFKLNHGYEGMKRKKLLPIATIALVILMSLTAVTAYGASTETLILEPYKQTSLI